MKVVASKADEIKSAYKETHSVNRTVKLCKVSEGVVIKTLVTAGIDPTPRSKEITRLRTMGLSTKEIVDRLHITPHAVEKYYPYERGTYSDYDEQKSKNARAIAKWRNKKEEERDEQTPPSERKLPSRRPYICNGHWGHFWAGNEEKGTKKLVSRWIAPYFMPGRGDFIAARSSKKKSKNKTKKL